MQFLQVFRYVFLVCIFEEESNWARPNENVIRLHFARTTFLFRILICYNTRADDQIIVWIRSTQWQNMHYYTYTFVWMCFVCWNDLKRYLCGVKVFGYLQNSFFHSTSSPSRSIFITWQILFIFHRSEFLTSNKICLFNVW